MTYRIEGPSAGRNPRASLFPPRSPQSFSACRVVRLNVICVTCVAAWLILGLSAQVTAEVRVVVPPGLGPTEGNGVDGSGNTPTNGFRVQELHPASDFPELPEGHNAIGAIAWRPDKTVTSQRIFIDESAEVRLSTTSATPDTLSLNFADNIGDDERVVFSGALRFETDGSGDPEGPRPFDYLIEVDPPFAYVPSPGNNLLVELRLSPRSETQGVGLVFDGHESNGAGVFALNETALMAVRRITSFPVKEFTFVPEPNGLGLATLGLLIVVGCRRTRLFKLKQTLASEARER